MSEHENKKKILIVDDSSYYRSKSKKLLDTAGYKVIMAEDGLEGAWLYKHEKPDLVLMDINMPIMEGIESLEYIKKIDHNAVVIMFSTLDDEKTIAQAIKAGAKDYIVKTMVTEKVLETIRKFL